MLQFRKYSEKVEFLDPRNKFEKSSELIEHRQDSLLKTWCRINVNRAKRPASVAEKADVNLIKESKKKCLFCPAKIKKSTPKFLPDIVKNGRIEKGNFVIFPNLYPFSLNHSVGVLTKKHFAELNKLDASTWKNCIKGSIEFFDRIYRHNNHARYSSINFNYMMPAGASLVHPHVQVMMESKPAYYTGILYEKSLRYFMQKDSSYWDDLVAAEKIMRERIIHTGKNVSWLASFSPFKNNDVIGIVSKANFFHLDSKDINELSKGLGNVFRGLWKRGVRSANMSIISGPADELNDDFFSIIVRIISRPLPSTNHISDMGFMEVFHKEPVVTTLPEDTAKDLRKEF